MISSSISWKGWPPQYEGSQLQRQVYVDGRPKSANKDLPYSVDALFTAINTGRMVRFRYKKAGRPAPYTISPWQMAWENGCYYLIAYQDEKEPVGIRHYRVDKMAGVTVLDEPRRGKEQFADFDLPAYLKKHFQMFGGPEYRVTLRCTSDLESAMRERFGASPIFVPEGKEHLPFRRPRLRQRPVLRLGLRLRRQDRSRLARRGAGRPAGAERAAGKNASIMKQKALNPSDSGPFCINIMLKLLCVEHIPVHPVERLFNAGAGRGQIDAQMAGAVEHHAVLHGSTDGPAGFLHVLNGLAVGGAPVGAVHKEHIGAFGLCHMDTL